jgi:predicted small lipoprotein YifL
MIKVLIVTIAFVSLAACGGNAPPPTSAGAQPFSIISERADQATGSANVIITFPISTLPPQIKAAAESLIESRRNEYRQVTVKSFLEGSDLNGTPLAISRIENDTISTVFNGAPGGSPAPGGSVRIPTH